MFKKICTALIFCIAASLAPAQTTEPVFLFREPNGSPGKINPISPEDEGLHPMDTFWYTENWFFIAVLEDGHIAYVNLMVSNMGLEKMQPALSFTIITPDRQAHTTEAEFNPEDLQVAKDGFEIRIGRNTLQGKNKLYRLKLKNQGLAMDLTYASKTKGFQLGSGKAEFGKEKEIFYYINYPAPRAEVQGSLTINGETKKVRGWGYMDHCYYNADATKFENIWHNLKFYSSEYSVLLTSFTTPPPYEKDVALASIISDQEILCATTDVSVKGTNIKQMSEDQGGKPYPQILDVHIKCQNGINAKTTFQASDLVEKMDVLEKLNKGTATRAIKFFINTFIARPYYYRAIGPADVELTIDGQTQMLSGQAVSEVIFTK